MDYEREVDNYILGLPFTEWERARALFKALLNDGFEYSTILNIISFAGDIEGLLFNSDIYSVLREMKDGEDISLDNAKKVKEILENERLSLSEFEKEINIKYNLYHNNVIKVREIEELFLLIQYKIIERVLEIEQEKLIELIDIVNEYYGGNENEEMGN